MRDIFISILNMSLTASYVVLGVMLARLLLRRVPRKFSYLLWLIVLFRLICPFSLQSILSLIPKSPQNIPLEVSDHTIPITRPIIISIDPITSQPLQPAAIPGVTIKPDLSSLLLNWAMYLWITGMVVLLVFYVYQLVRLKRRLSTAILLRENVYETDRIRVPFVLGFIRPRIYLPISHTAAETGFIIEHEKMHILHLDHVIKPLAYVVLVMHWFNPLIWLACWLMVKDMEMTCDESVLVRNKEDIRSSYAKVLLTCSIKRSGLIFPLAFGENNIRARIKNVLNYKKPTFWIILATIIFVAGLATGLLVNPPGGQDHKPTITETTTTSSTSQSSSSAATTSLKETSSETHRHDYRYGFDPRPPDDILITKNPDKGEVYANWQLRVGIEFLDNFDYSSRATPPYNSLLSGCDRQDPTLGIILNTVYPYDSLEEYTQTLTYPGKGKITFESFANGNTIVLFTYGNDQQGYFDTTTNKAFFYPIYR